MGSNAEEPELELDREKVGAQRLGAGSTEPTTCLVPSQTRGSL